MGLARIVMRAAKPLIASMSRSSAGRAALLAPLKARPSSTSPEEAIGVREGFAESRDFGRTVVWALMLDVPRGLDRIDCPVTLIQGVADWVAAGQTARYLPLIPGSRFRSLLMAGHTPQSDRPATITRLVEQTAAQAAAGRRPCAPSPSPPGDSSTAHQHRGADRTNDDRRKAATLSVIQMPRVDGGAVRTLVAGARRVSGVVGAGAFGTTSDTAKYDRAHRFQDASSLCIGAAACA